MARDQQFYLNKYKMTQHEEGGFYSETYRSELAIYSENVQEDRPSMTSIYFLLSAGDNSFSSFHKMKSDEIWNFHDGGDLAIYIINSKGTLTKKILGKNHNDAEPQIIVPREHWFAAELLDSNAFSLVGCTVSPGFVYQDWELADRSKLVAQYPNLQHTISRLTRTSKVTDDEQYNKTETLGISI